MSLSHVIRFHSGAVVALALFAAAAAGAAGPHGPYAGAADVRATQTDASPCDFVLGFAALRDRVGAATVGACVEDQWFAGNGDARQRTTGGLLVWRKADNWTAFTDGYRTWIDGPSGLVARLNTERFPWESGGEVSPPAEPPSAATSLDPAPPGSDPDPTETPPATGEDVPSHDWRTPGFVAVVGGQIFDGRCVPLRSVGSNVPNLPFRGGWAEELEWMRTQHVRWVRVFATGHGLGPDRAPRAATAAAAALRALLTQVEAFNAAHSPDESIYVLVALTDYYPPGVPGDRFAYDHPMYRASPVLPAPWYRGGARRFDFAQEHGFGTLTGMPNYEVNYLPWVRQIVPSLAGSPALMGWQLGNELKARSSPRNGIDPSQAYAWYLTFTQDVVDSIRALDHDHLIFMGAQYVAELVDWAYRPVEAPAPELLPTYNRLVGQAAAACGRSCWNVWGLTGYDFNAYPLDDAAAFGRAGIASVFTEYGFTRGTVAAMQARFGGDRAAAVRAGLTRGWTDAGGTSRPREWGVSEMVAAAPVAGVAPWASPAPGPWAGLDADAERGVTLAPDAAPLWSAWSDVAAGLEAANRAAGPSSVCRALQSS